MSDEVLQPIALRYGFSIGAAHAVRDALLRGLGGSLAQFDHAELGGPGQWMPGMIQIGAMFDDRLKARVAALFADVAAHLSDDERRTQMEPMKPMRPMEPMRGMEPMKPMEAVQPWWPDHLGAPNASGGQNGVRYAYFNRERRLLVDVEGYVAAYDTADHQINGIAQAQGDGSQIVFRSNDGPIPLESLRAVTLE